MSPGAVRGFRIAVAVTTLLTAAACTEAAPPEPPVRQVAGPNSGAVQKGAFIELGRSLLASGEPELAYNAFLASIRVDGISADALIGAGIAVRKQGLLTQARRYFEKALELEPDSVSANNNLGVVLLHLREYYPARDAFRVAYAVSSGTSEVAERNLNRVEAVIAEIELAGQEDPNVSHRVVRLGSGVFRITPKEETPAEMIEAE